jgi:hypothetical protein
MKILGKSSYHLAADLLSKLTINQLFARAVVEQNVDGKIYVDDTEKPTTFLIAHPYGMSLLFGNENNESFNAEFVDYALNGNLSRQKTEWLQAFPASWNEKLAALFADNIISENEITDTENKDKIELSTRVNFRFNEEKYLDFKRKLGKISYEIVRTSKQHFEEINGTVVPKYFWNDANDFNENAVGFSLIYEGKPASTAFSAFIIDQKLEIGIESAADVRGKGFAQYTCSVLIDYCLENGYEPIWACRLENTVSYKLAQKLGFEPTLYIPFYKLAMQ